MSRDLEEKEVSVEKEEVRPDNSMWECKLSKVVTLGGSQRHSVITHYKA